MLVKFTKASLMHLLHIKPFNAVYGAASVNCLLLEVSLDLFPLPVHSLLSAMDEPAELLLIKDQYELAFHALSRGLSAEEAGRNAEALNFYTKAQQHLNQGLQVPTWGQKRAGAAWDQARQFQQRMRQALGTVNSHLFDLQTTGVTAGDRRSRLLSDLPHNLYPELKLNTPPPHSSVHHLYPSLPANTRTAAPGRPPRPAAPHRQALAAAASMATARDQPPAYTPQPTGGHRSVACGPAGGSQAAAGQGDGEELLFIPSGVQMFFVAPNGAVSSMSCPGFLRIVTRTDQKASSAQRTSALLNVSDQVQFMWVKLSPTVTISPGCLAFLNHYAPK